LSLFCDKTYRVRHIFEVKNHPIHQYPNYLFLYCQHCVIDTMFMATGWSKSLWIFAFYWNNRNGFLQACPSAFCWPGLVVETLSWHGLHSWPFSGNTTCSDCPTYGVVANVPRRDWGTAGNCPIFVSLHACSVQNSGHVKDNTSDLIESYIWYLVHLDSQRFCHPVHTLPSTALLWLGCHWPCRNPLWFPLVSHAETRWPIRSHDPARNLQYDSNRTAYHQTLLTLTPNSKQPRLPPLIHARQPGVPTLDFRDTHDLYCPAPRPL
jgi:hypothetical protein